MSNIFIELKKDLFGCFRMEEIRDKDNKTGLKEKEVIEIETTVLSIYAMHALHSLCIYSRVKAVAIDYNISTSFKRTNVWYNRCNRHDIRYGTGCRTREQCCFASTLYY